MLLTTMIVLGTDLCKNIDIYSFTEKASHMLAGLWPESEIYRELKGEALVLQGLLTLLRGDVFSYVREALKYRREGACVVRSLLVFVLFRVSDGRSHLRTALHRSFTPPREAELLPLMAQGVSNMEIVEKLCISTAIGKAHLKHVFKKLTATNRIGALNSARDLGLINPT